MAESTGTIQLVRVPGSTFAFIIVLSDDGQHHQDDARELLLRRGTSCLYYLSRPACQIEKAAEPAFEFAWSALISSCFANCFATVKDNENKKLMETDGLKDRMGLMGNPFCITCILVFLLSIPFVLLKEGSRFGDFVEASKTVCA